MILFLVRMFGILANGIGHLFESCGRLWRSVEEVFGPREYIFFDYNPAPYLYSAVKETADGSANPIWIYDTNTKTFSEYDVEGEGRGGNVSKLPLLSLEVVFKDKIKYDLTDFIDNIRVRTIGNDVKAGPSIAHILGAWGLSSGIVLDSMQGLDVRIIDEMANTIEMPAFEYSDLYDVLAGVADASADAEDGDAVAADAEASAGTTEEGDAAADASAAASAAGEGEAEAATAPAVDAPQA
jgi:hypothetical protein